MVEDADGRRRLVECSAAGGYLALQGARYNGVITTTRKEEDIRRLRDRVRGGGTYGLTFVAVGEWDITKKRFPFIVVGFYHMNAQSTEEAAISRSSLGKILSPREAERLIVEGITGHQDSSLRDTLYNQISMTPMDSLSAAVPNQSSHAQGPNMFGQHPPYLQGGPEPWGFPMPSFKT